MTITKTTSAVQHVGNDATTSWPFGFNIPTADDVAVLVYDSATGAISSILPSAYTVAGLGDEAGGTITYPLSGSPLTTTQTITIARKQSPVQGTDFDIQGGVHPSVIEPQLDKIVMMVQELYEQLGRSVSIELGSLDSIDLELPAPDGGKFIGWNNGGNALENKTGVSNTLAWEGTWAQPVSYGVNDLVENGDVYICKAAHTSAAATEPGVGGSWGTVWDLFVPQPILSTARLAKTNADSPYSQVAGDAGKVVDWDASGGACVHNLLPVATAGTGFVQRIIKTDSSANTVTVDADGTETINGELTYVLRAQYDYVDVYCTASAWVVINAGRALTLPYSAGPTLAQNGEVAIDSAENTVNVRSSGATVVLGTFRGEHTVPLPWNGWTPYVTNGPAAFVKEGSNQNINGWAFDQSTIEYLIYEFVAIKSFDLGTCVARFQWYDEATGSGTVRWEVQAVGVGDGDTRDAAFGTAQNVEDASTGVGGHMVSGATGAFTITNVAAGDTIVMRVSRNASHVNDTFAADAILTMVEVDITLDKETDT